MHNSVICTPSLDEWSEHIKKNSEFIFVDNNLNEMVSRLRREMYAESLTYTNNLTETLPETTLPKINFEKLASSKHLIGCAHQPIIYTPGVMAKNQHLQQYCAKNKNSIGINIIMDLENGDGGSISFPEKKLDGLILSHESISTNESDQFKCQKVLEPKIINPIFDGVMESLHTLSTSIDMHKIKYAKSIYKKLYGVNISEANTLVRRVMEEKPSYLELPFSKLLMLDSSKEIINYLLQKISNQSVRYNSILDKYRESSNHNPFPNLKRHEDKFEMPFWVYNLKTNSRRPLYIKQNFIKYSIEDDELLVPRHAMISLFLRLFCFDFFVHGLGGNRYDEFTDLIIKDLFNIDPPSFATVSQTIYLLPSKIDDFQKDKETASQLRDIISHSEKYLSANIFETDQAKRLSLLIKEKENYIQMLDKKRNMAKIHLNKINAKIRDELTLFIEKRNRILLRIDDMSHKTLFYRGFPFFFFSM
jgi:hypothetical protein